MYLRDFRKYTIALKNLNLFNYAAEATDFEIVIAGTNVKLIGLNGLNGTNKLFASRWSNIYLGVDLLNEEERFELFYAKEADEMRFVAEFKMGVNYAFPSEIVYFALA
jgi:spore coat polysaccharide biosynthesis protein SpsF (cytidylyltransferase family)